MKPNQGSETVLAGNGFWNEFATALATQAEKRPTGKGWRSMAEWVTESGHGRSATNSRLTQGVKIGLLERFEGTVQQDGRLVRAVWYRRKGAVK